MQYKIHLPHQTNHGRLARPCAIEASHSSSRDKLLSVTSIGRKFTSPPHHTVKTCLPNGAGRSSRMSAGYAYKSSKVMRDQPSCILQPKLLFALQKPQSLRIRSRNTPSKLILFCAFLLAMCFPAPQTSSNQVRKKAL